MILLIVEILVLIFPLKQKFILINATENKNGPENTYHIIPVL